MANVIWLPGAKEDIARLHTFLKEKNPRAARQALEAIRAGARELEAHPQLGRPMNDETGRRELFIPVGRQGYVLRYMLDVRDVVVIRVWHARERR